MAYSGRSVWNSPADASAWLLLSQEGRRYLLTTTGYGFVAALNTRLVELLREMPNTPVGADSQPITWQYIQDHLDTWTRQTQFVLLSVSTMGGSPPEEQGEILNEINSNRVGFYSIQAAVLVLLGSGHIHAPPGFLPGAFMNIELPNESGVVVFPPQGRPLPRSPGGVEPVITLMEPPSGPPPGVQVQQTVIPTSAPETIAPGTTQPVAPVVAAPPPAATPPQPPSPIAPPRQAPPTNTAVPPQAPPAVSPPPAPGSTPPPKGGSFSGSAPTSGSSGGKPPTAGPSGGKPPASTDYYVPIVLVDTSKPVMAVGQKPSAAMVAVVEQKIPPKPVQTNTGREIMVAAPPPSMTFQSAPLPPLGGSRGPSTAVIVVAVALAVLAIGGIWYASSGRAAPAPELPAPEARANPRKSRKRRRKTAKPTSQTRTSKKPKRTRRRSR